MEYLREFKNISYRDVSLAGGKGASLGELTGLGVSVPPGFVILTHAFDEFIINSKLKHRIEDLLKAVKADEMTSLESTSEKVRRLILESEMPNHLATQIEQAFGELGSKYVAVRSSATAEDSASAAWAGQLDSYLNTTEKDLLENVRKCWASLYTARAISYRYEKELLMQPISVAVVVQEMVNSEKSGVAFSVHPITEDKDQIYIEAGLGLGEAIVGGAVVPDRYLVDKQLHSINQKFIGSQLRALYRSEEGGNEWREIERDKGCIQVLTDDQIVKLSEIVHIIEGHYHCPCDVEWALESGKIYIVQSRPITTLGASGNLPKVLTKYMTREQSMFYAHVWNEANRDHLSDYVRQTNIKDMAFVLNHLGLLEVYYEIVELDGFFKAVADETIGKPDILDKVIHDFYFYWNRMKPFLLSERKIQNVGELQEYYQNWVKWWATMAYIFVLPDQGHVPLNLRGKALKVREETQAYSAEADRVFTDFVKDKFPEYADIVSLLTPQEVWKIESLTDNEIENIKDRKASCALTTINGKSSFGLLSEIEKTLSENNILLEIYAQESKEEIYGLTASLGVVTGKARLVLTKSDLASIEDGEVMVTYATSPDYVPSMKKCVAIVTDEGGVVCHAAIVAREFKLPCVVGTKIATQTIKDGDLLEVNADLGIVRILK